MKKLLLITAGVAAAALCGAAAYTMYCVRVFRGIQSIEFEDS